MPYIAAIGIVVLRLFHDIEAVNSAASETRSGNPILQAIRQVAGRCQLTDQIIHLGSIAHTTCSAGWAAASQTHPPIGAHVVVDEQRLEVLGTVSPVDLQVER